MPLGFLLFPQTAFTFALAMPYSFLMTLTALGLLWATAASKQRDFIIAAKLGVACGLLPFLHPIGFGLSMAVAVIAMVARHNQLFLMWYVAMTLAVGLVVLLGLQFPVQTLGGLPFKFEVFQSSTLQAGVLRPFAMLWLAFGFSALALWRSKALRLRIGREGVQRSILLGFIFLLLTATLLLSPPQESDDPRVFLNATVGLGLLAVWPMVMWIRFVMPTIQSIWIWILLPVVMYSCFWVVMGPIDLAGFPYDQVRSRP